MIKKIMLLAVFLPVVSSLAGDLSVDNLTVSSNATVNGNLNFCSISVTNSTNGATATGGTITTNGNYRIHTFTNSGTFQVSGTITCDVLVVAGGGGGGYNTGGAGGAGGLLYRNLSLSESNSVIVGTAGTHKASSVGSNGGNSSLGTNIAYGGGGGGTWSQGAGQAGGSGGGGGANNGSSGSGTEGQGYGGGNGLLVGGTDAGGGGGGGANEAGDNAVSLKAGNGGDGKTYDISGESQTYAGGGGGSCAENPSHVIGYGGAGGGGDGGDFMESGENASYYGSGGGGGGGNGGQGGDGFQGIVIVRYQNNQSSSSNVNVTALTVSSNGINQVSASGSNIFMGNVGIGTNNPTEKLHVAGNVQVDGGIKFGGESRTNWPNVAVGALIASNNLSDVVDKAVARTNLELGSAATYDAGVFLTTNSDGSQLTNITAVQVGALTASNNLSDVVSVSASRANLGLGSAATSDTNAFDPAGAAANAVGVVSNALAVHTANVSNPHQVTAGQVGALTPTGDGSQLTGITAAQVGALNTTGGVVNGSLNVLSNLFVNGTNVTGMTGAFNPAATNLDMATNRIVNLGLPAGDNDAVSKYYLWVSLSNIPPMGDMSMGIYTNQSSP